MVTMFNSEGVLKMRTLEEFLALLEKAIKGDASCQFQVGISYCTGLGVTKDRQQGFMWLGRAAEQGCEGAKHVIALIKHEDEQPVHWSENRVLRARQKEEVVLRQYYEQIDETKVHGKSYSAPPLQAPRSSRPLPHYVGLFDKNNRLIPATASIEPGPVRHDYVQPVLWSENPVLRAGQKEEVVLRQREQRDKSRVFALHG